MITDIFDILDKELASVNFAEPKFSQKILTRPIHLTEKQVATRNSNYSNLNRLFERTKAIFRSRLKASSTNDLIIKILLNDSQAVIPLKFYSNLPENAWNNPVFFRTDESCTGKIFEVQCPGSGWGDYLLLGKVYQSIYPQVDNLAENFMREFYEGVKFITNKSRPKIIHLLDNSSYPSHMRFFLKETSKYFDYWGYSNNVKNLDCDLIRSHSVYGLIFENLFWERMKKIEKSETHFDLPPLLLFDQKAYLSLPFLDATKDYFDDEIRSSISHTYLVTPSGFRIENGDWVSISDFVKRPKNKRKYFLKYGGCDTSLNWGSRAVFRLDNNKAEKLLTMAAGDFANKSRPWIIQPDVSSKENITYLERGNVEETDDFIRTKYSSFYGPFGLLGVKTYHRHGIKVHGQSDTIVGIAQK